jgi:hypothetical protein
MADDSRFQIHANNFRAPQDFGFGYCELLIDPIGVGPLGVLTAKFTLGSNPPIFKSPLIVGESNVIDDLTPGIYDVVVSDSGEGSNQPHEELGSCVIQITLPANMVPTLVYSPNHVL